MSEDRMAVLVESLQRIAEAIAVKPRLLRLVVNRDAAAILGLPLVDGGQVVVTTAVGPVTIETESPGGPEPAGNSSPGGVTSGATCPD